MSRLRPSAEQRERDLAAAQAAGMTDDRIVYVPYWLIVARLGPEAFLLGSAILAHLDDDDVCRRSRDDLGRWVGLSPEAIDEAAARLEWAGMLDRDTLDGPWHLHPGSVARCTAWATTTRMARDFAAAAR